MSGSLVNTDPQFGTPTAPAGTPGVVPGTTGTPAPEGDIYAQFQQFFDWLSSLPPLTEEQLLQLGAQAPILGIYNEMQKQQLQKQQIEQQLKVLQMDFDLKGQELALAKLNLEYQSGPYHDYLMLKTQNDMGISNNQLGISQNELGMSRQQLLTSKQYTKQSMNQAAASAYGAKAAKSGADAAEFGYLQQQDRAKFQPWAAY